jgi:hypothetical protein
MTSYQYIQTKEIIKTKLFPQLRKKGFIARMNFSCCSTCASYELAEVAREKKKDDIVFYHQQDEETFKTRGKVYLRFFSMKKDGPHDLETGKIIAECAKQVGLKVDWDETPTTCILVTADAELL